MKRIVWGTAYTVLLISLLMSFFAIASDEENPKNKKVFTKHFQETLFDITENAAFSVEIILDEKEYKIGKGAAGIVVHNDQDQDVTGAKVTLVHMNLDTGQPAPGAIKVTEKGDGLYIVSGLDLMREGRWELIVAVSKGKGEDRVHFVFPGALKERHPKGRYLP